ncbi:arsenate reductase (glutaredoxin) [Undibacterium sp. CY7W]|uniref:Arsenate reductase (Glutaredoxin) n=1 Tax=Undibacterium rugosum TaxID=2762291 RepID=A0A923IB98_9BURK|nr:ArsC/Spx/MgsR family protein [Undibacterium rugosum]MBC3936943.1 arsenate reductase (glutaredoxin) [Undibacterium rugosum]
MIQLYHNPRCSKSRETLALLEQISTQQGLTLTVIDYQKTPLTLEQLQSLLSQLGGEVQAMLRANEEEYRIAHLADADNLRALQAIVATPKLLQRPIVSYQGQAVIARPPELVLGLFQKVNL